jgi:hypothetical protein
MKQLFRCEYCDEIGTEEEIREHEETCLWNYTKRTCYTCKHMENLFTKVKCKLDETKIPEGKYIEQCACWEFNEKDHTKKTPNIFGGLFGGL